MKDDSISRKKALDTVRAMCDRCDTGDVRDYRDLMVEAFEALPPADAVPVRHGKWIQFPTHMAYKCSECGRVIQTTDGQRNVSKQYPFCHCGARMDGKDGEGNGKVR